MQLFKAAILAAILPWLGLQSAKAADAAPPNEDSTTSALEQSVRLRERIESLNEQLADLESEYGPYDYRLQEPLQGLTAIQIELGDYRAAESILERRLQLVRTTEGPASLLQLPIVNELIDNEIRQSDWRSVTDRFEFVQSLYGQDANADPESLLRAKNDVALWNFANMYLFAPSSRIRAFREARELIRENSRLAEDIYGEDSMELVTWLYQYAVLQYQLVAVLVAEDELGVYARDEILYTEGRSAESYLREGLGLVKRIREIAEGAGDPETEAMAMTYEADYQMLLELGTAARLYSQAMDKFVEAGIDSEQVARFFQRPASLPVAKFYSRLEDAIQYQDESGFQMSPAVNGEPPELHLGTFVAWSHSLPFAQQPDLPAAAADLESVLEYHEIAMSFSLNSRGTTRDPRITDANTERARVRRRARDALRDMQFRPSFENGRWTRTENLSIRYLVLPD